MPGSVYKGEWKGPDQYVSDFSNKEDAYSSIYFGHSAIQNGEWNEFVGSIFIPRAPIRF